MNGQGMKRMGRWLGMVCAGTGLGPIASRSFVMPAREMLLSIQCHHVRGRDSAGESANPSANASAPHAIPATPRENTHTKDKRDDNSFFMFPSIAYRPSVELGVRLPFQGAA